jgi:DNA-binding HxlR family transcriptional regulator
MVIRLIDYDKYDIALFIYKNENTRWSKLLKEYVENGTERHISRQTLSKFLKELIDDGLIKKSVNTKLALLRVIVPVYKATKAGKNILQKIANKKEIFAFIDSASQEEIEKLQKEIIKLKKS